MPKKQWNAYGKHGKSGKRSISGTSTYAMTQSQCSPQMPLSQTAQLVLWTLRTNILWDRHDQITSGPSDVTRPLDSCVMWRAIVSLRSSTQVLERIIEKLSAWEQFLERILRGHNHLARLTVRPQSLSADSYLQSLSAAKPQSLRTVESTKAWHVHAFRDITWRGNTSA